MAMKAKFRSDAFEAVHSTVADMHRVGTLDAQTLQKFDALCLVAQADFQPAEITALRERNAISQPDLARYLNTSETVVRQWENGSKRPNGFAMKLLSVIDRHGLAVLD